MLGLAQRSDTPPPPSRLAPRPRCSRESYQDFLKCLNLFANEIISRQELMELVRDIIGRYPDLMNQVGGRVPGGGGGVHGWA